MRRWGTRPNMGYAKPPQRRIVSRRIYYSPPLPQFPEGLFIGIYAVLECGHEVPFQVHNEYAHCWHCPPMEATR